MSKKGNLVNYSAQEADFEVVGFSPIVAEAGAMQQAALSTATASQNSTQNSHRLKTQALASQAVGTTELLAKNTQKQLERIHKVIQTHSKHKRRKR